MPDPLQGLGDVLGAVAQCPCRCWVPWLSAPIGCWQGSWLFPVWSWTLLTRGFSHGLRFLTGGTEAPITCYSTCCLEVPQITTLPWTCPGTGECVCVLGLGRWCVVSMEQIDAAPLNQEGHTTLGVERHRYFHKTRIS